MSFEKLTQYLESLKDSDDIKGLDVIVKKDHKVIYRHMQGYSNYDCTRPVSEKDLYYLYSCTKVVTMTACMQQVEAGKIRLDDPVSQYLPEFADMRVADNYVMGDFGNLPNQSSPTRPAKTPIRIRDLMTMTAGLSYNTTSEPIVDLKKKSRNKASTREMVKAIAQMPLLYEPGTRHAYSLGHDVIAAVIEVVSGQKYRDYVREHIFRPLGADDVYFHLREEDKGRLADQYSCDFKTGEKSRHEGNDFELTDEYDSGGAGLITTVDCYSALLDALACGGVGANGNRILSEESIEALRTPQLNAVQLDDFTMKGMFRPGYNYGLGVRVLVDESKSKSPAGEFGWDGAAGAYALVDPKNGVSLFYAQAILGLRGVYSDIHPRIRDLVYECME
ncbi:MAG: serine hydrolase domain-containing protein [Acutalibacter sp.]|jgi:CubicO group peptidase (beta-lactamase class C family)